MNVIHVITRLIVGGAQENTIFTCRGLRERGHQVTLIAGPETGPEGSLWDQAQASGCDLVRLDCLRRAIRPIADLRARRDLRRMFAQRRPDIVHTHSSKAGIIARIAAAEAGVPTIVHTIHGMSFNRTQPPWRRLAYQYLERRAAAHTAGFIAVADSMIEQSVAAGIAPRHQFVTIRSGLDTSRFLPNERAREKVRAQWGIAGDEITVGTIARLFENKGYDEIIAAMPLMLRGNQNLRFVWIGDGKHRGRYERRLARLGFRERVLMLGLVPPAEVANAVNGFDMVLHASRWEGLPRAVVQGLLTEVPAVSFDNDGAPEVVIPGQTGVLVSYGDISGLADGVCALAADAGLRRRLGAAGRARCLSQFDWRFMVQQIESFYRQVTTRRM